MIEPIITIKQGLIKGTTGTNLDGENYYKFMGIPYAKPPIGSLRFKAPKPPESWSGVRDCTKKGNACMSYPSESNQIKGSEDCLYLNVFTRKLPQNSTSLKPVMVSIHAGGFTAGSGSESMQGSKFLMTEDIVLVTFNYRLGIFGFLSTDDPSLDVPGNAGLKDQTFALKWIQENISRFNGDPNNVTIFGMSSGGASVSFQVLSPTAKGLFHKAIAQSGCALSPFAWGRKNSIEIAELLGRKVSTEKEALRVIMEASGEELVDATRKIPDVLVYANIRRPFGPVIEIPNPTAFLTENPLDLLTSGKYNQVTMIQGVTSNEGMLHDKCVGPNGTTTSLNGVMWGLGLGESIQKRKEVEKCIEDFYFKNGMTTDSIMRFSGDVNFLYGVVESTRLIAKTSVNPIYFYVYSHEFDLSNIMKKLLDFEDDNISGICHAGEQTVLFDSKLLDRFEITMTDENKYGVRQLVKLWTNFARTGRPHKKWPPVTNVDELVYLDINKEARVKINPFAKRVVFWENLLKRLQKIDAKKEER